MDRFDLATLFPELERHGVIAADGVQLASAASIASTPFDPGWPLVLLPRRARDPSDGAADAARPRDGAQGFTPRSLPGRAAHDGDAVAVLRSLYPEGHPVRGLGAAGDRTVGTLTHGDLDAAAYLLPPLVGETNAASPHGLPWLVARLRAPGGCPWDAEQTHLTLRKFLLEEAYEVYDALDAGSTATLAEELGDLLLQIVLHAHYGAEAGVFDLTDVYRGVVTKIVRRHPHVFGEAEAATAADVIRNWETIKADERAARGEIGSGSASSEMPAAFAGLSRSLPALAYAQEIQERAASLGYDWPDVAGVMDKIQEEAQELTAAPDDAMRREEFGDLLLVMVNLARKLGIDAEASLRSASRKFASRFAHVERLARERQVDLRSLDLAGLDELWERAKDRERGHAAGGAVA